MRTKALKAGEPLSAVTARIAASLDVEVRVLPATDDRLRTIVETPAGAFSLQEWFVGRQHKDKVDGLRFEGAAFAKPAPGVLDAIEQASLVVIAPSNPYISVWPILAVGAIRVTVQRKRTPVVAVSPARRRQGRQGPGRRDDEAARRRDEPAHVARCYPGLLDALVIDQADAAGATALEEVGVRPHVTRTLMKDKRTARLLAEAVLEAARAG